MGEKVRRIKQGNDETLRIESPGYGNTGLILIIPGHGNGSMRLKYRGREYKLALDENSDESYLVKIKPWK